MRRPTLLATLAAALLALGGCHPIDTYRDLTGASKNDPNPATTPNTQNLAAGEKSPFPNLATVPEPPTQELTTAERDKLTQSLIADRKNAKYTSEQLQAGYDESAGAPPPPPPVPSAGGPPSPASATRVSLPAAPGGEPPSTAPSAAAPPPSAGRVASATPAAAEKGPRKPGEPPEPGPMESSLQSPQIPSLPQAEAPQPAPPPPPELRMPASGKPGAAKLPPPPPAAPMPASIASAQFQPPPPPPVLPPAGPAVSAATGPGKSAKQPSGPPVDTPVAQINFAADSTSLSDADRQSLGKVVPLYRRDPGKVRVVGYTGVGSSADQQLNGFQAALDRAQAVAAALAKAGIPSDKILIEAAPAGEDSGQSRAVVMLEH